MNKFKQLTNKLKNSQITMGAGLSYLTMGISIITGLFYTPWMVHKIGQANYGLYTLATSLIAIFMLDFGLGSAVSRFVSKYRAEGNQNAINKILGAIYKLYFAIDAIILVVLVVIFFLLDSIYVKLTPAEMETFRIIYVMVAGFNLISFPLSPLSGILNAYEKFIQLKLCDLFHKLSIVIFVVIALIFTSNIIVVVAAHIVSGIATLIIKLIVVKKQINIKIDYSSTEKSTYKSLFGFTIWTTIVSIMQRFTHSFAPSVLGMTSSATEIGIYSPAVTLEGYFYTFAIAINGLFLPRISRFIADKKENEILNLMIKVGRYQITVLGLIFVGFACVGQEFMVLWLGPEYEKSYICTLIMIFPGLISYSQQIANTTLIAKNLVRYQAKFMLISGVLGLGLSYVLSSYIGSIGVCIGTALTSIANLIYMNTVYQRKVGINIIEFYKKCWLKAFPCYAIVIIIGIAITRNIPLFGWLGLIVKSAVVAVIYAIVFAFIYFSSTDRKEFLSIVKRK